MGANTVGIAIVAKSTSGKNPLSKTTSSPVAILQATHLNGIGSLLKSLTE